MTTKTLILGPRACAACPISKDRNLIAYVLALMDEYKPLQFCGSDPEPPCGSGQREITWYRLTSGLYLLLQCPSACI
jgi:hypothetical protein